MTNQFNRFTSLHKLSATLLVSLFIFSCARSTPELVLVNNSDIDRIDEPVVIPRELILDKTGTVPEGKLPLLHDEQGNPIPSQLDDLDNDNMWDEMAIVANIRADESRIFTIHLVDSKDYPEFKPRTNIRFGVKQDSVVRPVETLELAADDLPIPLLERFQMDGPAWENDRIGFRQYIDGRNARDLFGKTTTEMALEHVGLTETGELIDNYHVLEPWGRDILAVGNSLGIGGLGVMHKGTEKRLGIKPDEPRGNVEITRYRLVTEGPVRSVFELEYNNWQVGEDRFDINNLVTIWAGKYWHSNTVTLQSSHDSDTLIVGLVNSNNNKPLIQIREPSSGWIGLATHDKQTYDKEYYLGMALLLPNQVYIGFREAPDEGPDITTSFNAMLRLQNGHSLTYHVLAGWELSNKNFSDQSYFKYFVENELAKIDHPVTVH